MTPLKQGDKPRKCKHEWVLIGEENPIKRDWYGRVLPIVKATFAQQYECEKCNKIIEEEQCL